MHSKDTQLLTVAAGQTLTGAFVASSRSLRLESKSSLQVELLYVPHADTVAAAADSKYVDVYLELTNVKDTQAISGMSDPADADWHPYKEEVDDGAGNSTMMVRHWLILSTDGTAQIDLSGVFSRPVFVNRARLRMKELGVGSSFGKLIVKASAQSI